MGQSFHRIKDLLLPAGGNMNDVVYPPFGDADRSYEASAVLIAAAAKDSDRVTILLSKSDGETVLTCPKRLRLAVGVTIQHH